MLNYSGRAGKGAKVNTSQFQLNVGALGLIPLTAVKVDVTLADAEVEIDSIKCKADGTPAGHGMDTSEMIYSAVKTAG